MTSPTHSLRVTMVAFALATAGLTAGHAAAKNHDCQAFRLPTATPLAQHDKAPGPSLRQPG